MKVIEQDVAGVGLNCGCPKSFSLSGGMGAALLKEPEKLCSVRPLLLSLFLFFVRQGHTQLITENHRVQILTALVKATDLPVDAKIRLLPLPRKGDAASAAASSLATPVATPPPAPAPATDPAQSQRTPSAILEPTVPPTLTVNADADAATAATASSDAETAAVAPSSSGGGEEEEEPTLALVARIFDTGIANLTVHCRTQEMRSREPALHERMRGITEMGKQRGVPVVCNGDAVGGGKDAGWGNFDQVCEKTGTFDGFLFVS